MFIAVAGLPEAPSALKDAAVLCGLTQMEVGARCAGVLPRVLVRQANEAETQRLLTGLQDLGFRAFAAEARQIPGDTQRIIARQLEWTEDGFAVTEGKFKSTCNGTRAVEKNEFAFKIFRDFTARIEAVSALSGFE